jgi:hypothetical protein
MGEEFLKAFRNELGLNSGGNNITNRNVATFIELFAKNEDDIRKINSLKTGDWIKVRGKITGTSFRSIELNPAIFWNVQKTSNQEGQINKNVNNTKESNQVTQGSFLTDTQRTRLLELLNKKRINCNEQNLEEEILINEMVLFVDKNNKILVYLARGARSSDVVIYDLKDNSLESINSSYPENNRLHKIYIEDAEQILQDHNSCNFKDNLVIQEFFTCNNNNGSLTCKWNL